MFKCLIYKRKIIQYIDNELDEKWRNKVSKHIKLCEKCREIYDSYANLISEVAEIFEDEVQKAEPVIYSNILKSRDSVESKENILDKITDIIYTTSDGDLILENTLVKLIPAILIALFILLFFPSPLGGTMQMC